MKQIATSYNFDSVAKTVLINGVNVPESQLLLIAGKGKVLFSLADGIGLAGYTQGVNSQATLQSSQGLTNTDRLTIFYDDGVQDAPGGTLTGTLINRSGTISTANSSREVAPANSTRRYFVIQNHSNSIMYVAFGTPATTSNGLALTPGGGSIVFENTFVPSQQINVICELAGKDFVAWEG